MEMRAVRLVVRLARERSKNKWNMRKFVVNNIFLYFQERRGEIAMATLTTLAYVFLGLVLVFLIILLVVAFVAIIVGTGAIMALWGALIGMIVKFLRIK